MIITFLKKKDKKKKLKDYHIYVIFYISINQC